MFYVNGCKKRSFLLAIVKLCQVRLLPALSPAIRRVKGYVNGMFLPVVVTYQIVATQ